MALRVDGDLLAATEDYIAHQCNCISMYAQGLARTIFERHPEADDYARRHDAESHRRRCPGIDELGSIRIYNTQNTPYRGVINMMAQYYPGKPQKHYRGKDLAEDRLRAFQGCLEAIAARDDVASVAFPHRIGCGLAGGNWSVYRQVIDDWAKSHPRLRVVIYKHKPNKRGPKRESAKAGVRGALPKREPKRRRVDTPES